jgi:hypothetical protein
MTTPELLVAPATKDPSGAVTTWEIPPPDYSGCDDLSRRQLERAARLVKIGSSLLGAESPYERWSVAERCLRDALYILIDFAKREDPCIACVYGRLGVACHLQGKLDDAEHSYLLAIGFGLRALHCGSLWTELARLNLAVLYAAQGQYRLHQALMREMMRKRGVDFDRRVT